MIFTHSLQVAMQKDLDDFASRLTIDETLTPVSAHCVSHYQSSNLNTSFERPFKELLQFERPSQELLKSYWTMQTEVI